MLLHIERLSPNVLLCLFDGEINSVAIHQKPETLHCGLDTDGQIPPILLLQDLARQPGDRTRVASAVGLSTL
jgi:hypothetical protein